MYIVVTPVTWKVSCMSFGSHMQCVIITIADLLESFQGRVQAALPMLQVCHPLRQLKCKLFLSPLLVLYIDSKCLRDSTCILMKSFGGA